MLGVMGDWAAAMPIGIVYLIGLVEYPRGTVTTFKLAVNKVEPEGRWICGGRKIVVLGEAAFTSANGRTVYQVDGSNAEDRIRVEDATPAEVWHRAVEAAASCGMLADWPRPSGRSG